MAGSIANLNVKLTASIGSFAASMASAAKPLKSFAGSVATAGSMVVGLGGAAVALVAGGSIAALTHQSMEAIDTNAKLADRLGLTTEGLVGLQYAGDLAGVSSEQLTGALEKMLKGLGGAADDGELASNAFSKLGLSATELANIPADEAFTKIAEKISAIENPTERATAAMGIFGKSGQALLPLLTSGAEGIKAAQEEAQKLGLTYSRVDAAKVEAANDAMTRAGKIVEGVGNQFAIGLAPYIETAATMLKDFAIQGGGIAPKVGGAIEFVAHAIAVASDYLQLLSMGFYGFRAGALQAIAAVVGALATLQESAAGVANFFGADVDWGSSLRGLATGLEQVAAEEAGKFNDSLAAFSRGDNSAAVTKAFDEIKNKASESAKGIADNAEKMKGAFKGIEDSSKSLQKVQDALAALQTQVEQAGMSDAQKKVDDLKRLGASPEQIAEAEAALKKLDALSEAKKKAEEMQSKGKSVFDETRTPMEKYTERLTELSDLLSNGAIDWDTYGRAVRAAKGELEKSADKTDVAEAPEQNLDAIKAGSAAALRFSYDNSRGVQRLSRDDIAKKSLTEQQSATKVLERIEKNTATTTAQEVDI